jgi:hypothetical protein
LRGSALAAKLDVVKHRIHVLVSAVGFACAGCDPSPLMLNDQDSGREVALAMQQAVDITLHTTGPGGYGTPTLSSSAVSFEGLTYPAGQVPGGPTQLYQFTATVEGSAVLSIPFQDGIDSRAPFTLTFRCCTQ